MRRFLNEVPDELLLKIVGCFESTFDETELRFDSKFDANITTIQNLRLTCRRLCEIGSQFLVPYIHVTPSLSSLNHLDQVASHPTISRGLRRIFVNMAVLGAELADDFQSFSENRYERLERIIRFYLDQKQNVPRMKDFEMKCCVVSEILDSVNTPNDDGTPSNRPGKRESSLRKSIQREHSRYRALYEDQKSILQSGRLKRSVAAAAARGRSDVGLYISDEHKDPVHGDPFGIRQALRKHGDRKMDDDLVIRFIGMREGQRWAQGGGDLHEALPSVLYELPLAISAAGTNLTELVIDTTAFGSSRHPILDMTQEQVSALQQVSRNLETFKFRVGGNGSVETKDLSTYVTAVTGSQILANLSLDLSFVKKNFQAVPPSNPCAIGPLRLSETWKHLETLALSEYRMHPNEMEKLLSVLKPGVRIAFKRITLLRGSWAEALDHIRAKAGPGSEITACAGSEAALISMRPLEYNAVFGYSSFYRYGNMATDYIRSVEGVVNPLHQIE